MVRPLSTLFALYTLTPGRRIYALGRVAERAKAKQLNAFLDLIQMAISQDRLALELASSRAEKSPSPQARKHDAEVDRTLGAIEGLVSHFGASDDPDASKLLRAMFPTNVSDHVHLGFIEQAAANERVLAMLEGPQYASWIDAHGVRPLVLQLRSAHDSFAAALHARDVETTVSWEQVKAARELGQELYLKVVIRIVAEFIDDPAARDELLEPIWAQDEQMRVHRRQRRRPVEVDPATGEPLPEGTAGEFEAEPQEG